MKRGTITKRNATLIAVWVPKKMASAVDLAIHEDDEDRSKFVRKAIRDRLVDLGFDPDKLPAHVAA